MNGRQRGTAIGAALAAAVLAGTALMAGAQAPQTQGGQGAAPAAAPKTAGEAFKNVRVLKDIPADQLIPTMQFISASLGVECKYCHVQGAFEKDDLKPKKAARTMIQMMAAIDKDNFDGDRDVTCFTCHRGSPKPASIPLIAAEETKPAAESGAAPALPSADQLLAKYAQAVGAEALEKVTSRVQKGQVTGFGGREMPIEVYAKAPDKRLSVMKTPRGAMITAYDGSRGWLTGRKGPQPMSASESEAARLDADLHFPLHVKQLFTAFAVRPSEKIDGRDAVLLLARNEDKPPLKLYFDAQTGLLLREERYADTALGYLPTQIDYADYRDVDGVKVAFRWTLARPGGRFTVQVDSTQQNVPIDDAKFAMPAVPPKPAG
ncbi:MAG TPA: c-type cytochrome [Thermoanaerobaculaceae bacterium]|nr:c-type cytochrome [Thermoanaerobaculaceae bacterium]